MSHRILILTLPVALTLALPDWRYSSGVDIDPWVYHGYFRHLRLYLTELFPGLYYGTRLGWIVPGFAAYSLFSPDLASLVLHSVFYAAAVLSLYEIVRPIAGGGCALVGALLFGLSLQSIRALGGDYVDGPVITYLLMSTALLQWAVRTGSRWGTVASGLAGGAMLHSNVGAAFLVPAILMWVVPFSSSLPAWRRALSRGFGWLMGVVLCTLALAQVNVLVGAPWTFFIPSFSWMARMGLNNPWDVPELGWFFNAPYLFLPAAALVGVLAVLISPARRARLDEPRVRSIGALAVTIVIFLAWDYLGPGAMLSVAFYASWLIPSSAIVLGAVVVGTADVSRFTVAAGLAVAAALLAAAVRPEIVPVPASGVSLACLLAGLAIAGGLLRSASASAAAVGLIALALQSSLAARSYYSPPGDRVDVFRTIDRAIAATDRYLDTKRPLLLLERNPAMAPYFNSYASVYLYGYVVISERYPQVDPDPVYRMAPGDLVIIVSAHPDERQRLAPVFASHGVGATVLGDDKIVTKAGLFHLTFVRTHPPADALLLTRPSQSESNAER